MFVPSFKDVSSLVVKYPLLNIVMAKNNMPRLIYRSFISQ